MRFLHTLFRFRLLSTTLLILGISVSAFAHDPGLSTIVAKVDGQRLEATVTFARKDLENLLAGIPGSDEKKTLTVAQLENIAPEIITVQSEGRLLHPIETHARFDDQNNVEFLIRFNLGNSSNLKIKSPWLTSLPRGHRQYLSLTDVAGNKLAEQLLSADADSATAALKTAPVSAKASILGFLGLGVEHILTGYDHLLFLFGLLIVTQRFSAALKIISCFTIAHSITLAAATLNWVKVPSHIVEPIIAASIVYVGVENFFCGGVPRWRWVLTFAFGLIHGLGFASALRDMGVGANGSSVAVPLVCFNLGVELGQLAVTALVLPVLWKLRAHPIFVRRWVPACSVAVAIAGSIWFVQRLGF